MIIMNPINTLKKIVLYLFLLLYVQHTKAQVFDSLSINVEGGIILSDYTINRRGNTGKHFNVNTEFPIHSFVAFTVGIGVANYGSQFNFTFPTDNNNEPIRSIPQGFNVTAYDFHYLSFPLRIKFHYRHFYAQLGIKPEFFLHQLPQDMGILYDEAYFEKPFHPIETIRTQNFSLDGSIGFIYYPNKSPFRLYIESGTSLFMKPIFTEQSASEHQLSFLLKLGAKWVIGKK